MLRCGIESERGSARHRTKRRSAKRNTEYGGDDRCFGPDSRKGQVNPPFFRAHPGIDMRIAEVPWGFSLDQVTSYGRKGTKRDEGNVEKIFEAVCSSKRGDEGTRMSQRGHSTSKASLSHNLKETMKVVRACCGRRLRHLT